jgi:hypothetical protein
MCGGRLMRRPHVAVGGLLALAGAAGLFLLFQPNAGDPSTPESAAVRDRSPAVPVVAADVPLLRPEPPEGSNLQLPSQRLADLHAGVSGREVLPHYMRLLQSRTPGSFGLAYELYGACMGAMIATVGYLKDRDGISMGEESPATAREPKMLRPEMLARRDAAAQEIKRRCEPVLQVGTGEQFELADPPAQRRQSALRSLAGNNPSALFGSAGAELSAQGLLFAEADGALANPGEAVRHFNGQALTAVEDINAYRLALTFARVEINLGSTPAPDNLFVLGACASGSNCDGDWRARIIQYNSATPAEQAKAMQMLPGIKAALEANNLNAFRPPKP